MKNRKAPSEFGLTKIWSDADDLDAEPWTPEDACLQGRSVYEQNQANTSGSNVTSSVTTTISRPWSSLERKQRKDAT